MSAQDATAEELLQCLPGHRLLAWYDDDTMWHEKILMWQASPASWYILTPDYDLYEEEHGEGG